jgi:hypothetical protein
MDEPFDDLTRGMAMPMSRRKALAVFAAGTAAAMLGLRPQRAYAGHCGTERVCETRTVNGKDVTDCWRPFGGDLNPSKDCKCNPANMPKPGQRTPCIDRRPHCGSSDKPCPNGVPPKCEGCPK